MTEPVHLLLALAAGILLGVFFFAGLWWTVRRLAFTRYPAPIVFASLLFRTSIVAMGFYVLMGDNLQALLAGALGFMLMRVFATRMAVAAEQSAATQERDHYAP